jgi:hypothetical protein
MCGYEPCLGTAGMKRGLRVGDSWGEGGSYAGMNREFRHEVRMKQA